MQLSRFGINVAASAPCRVVSEFKSPVRARSSLALDRHEGARLVHFIVYVRWPWIGGLAEQICERFVRHRQRQIARAN